jgi:glyoxalase family protein
VRTGFRVRDADSLSWWERRLADGGVRHKPAAERDGRPTIDFEDGEGQRLCLVFDAEHDRDAPANPWERSLVPAAHQILGLGPITMSVPGIEPTHRVLTEALNFRPVREYANGGRVQVYEMGPGGAAAELHVAVEPGLPPARSGAGGVHHVAFRTPDEAEYAAWVERLPGIGVRTSGPVNRHYFRSLYFREPNGILFEIATDGPGFAVDEPLESLGERLALPPFLEARRAEIEAGLKPID